MRTKALNRAERKEQIMLVMAADYQKNGEQSALTVADIARAMGQAASQKLRDMVSELAVVGELDVNVEDIPGCVGYRRWYSLPDGSKHKRRFSRSEKRALRINSKNSQQLVMWE